MTRRPRRSLVRVVVVAIIATVVAACGARPPSDSGDSMSTQQQFAELMQRPDIDEALTRYDQMRTAIRGTLTTTLDLPAWQEDSGTESTRGCTSAFPALDPYDVAKVHPTTWFTESALDTTRWAQAKTAVLEASAPFGFTKIVIASDHPGNFQLTIVDTYGAELSFGAAKNIVLALTTGCHLTATARQRGVPTPR